jgi:hypothetical protein
MEGNKKEMLGNMIGKQRSAQIRVPKLKSDKKKSVLHDVT